MKPIITSAMFNDEIKMYKVKKDQQRNNFVARMMKFASFDRWHSSAFVYIIVARRHGTKNLRVRIQPSLCYFMNMTTNYFQLRGQTIQD